MDFYACPSIMAKEADVSSPCKIADRFYSLSKEKSSIRQTRNEKEVETMVDVILMLLMNALFFLSLSAIGAGFIVIVIELFKNKEHAFKHHPTSDCVTC